MNTHEPEPEHVALSLGEQPHNPAHCDRAGRPHLGPCHDPDPVEIVAQLGAKYSPDFDAYASGRLEISQVRCLMCQLAPCDCEALGLTFGSAAYFARLDAMHGRTARPSPTCSDPECPMTARTGEHPRGIAISGPHGSAACIVDVPR